MLKVIEVSQGEKLRLKLVMGYATMQRNRRVFITQVPADQKDPDIPIGTGHVSGGCSQADIYMYTCTSVITVTW